MRLISLKQFSERMTQNFGQPNEHADLHYVDNCGSKNFDHLP